MLLTAVACYAYSMDSTDAWRSLAAELGSILGFAGPVMLVSLAGLIVPLLPAGTRFAGKSETETKLLFSAIRVSRHDEFWTADAARASAAKARRAGDYPFSQSYAHRLTCWRGILLNAGADPILDITVANPNDNALLIAQIGIEIIAAGCAPERRDSLSTQASAPIEARGWFAVQTPDTLELFTHAHRAAGSGDLFAMDLSLSDTTTLSEPFYLRPNKSFRFELRLINFCDSVPLHTLARLVLHTDDGVHRSPVIYFRR
jgi:hypothetical protein